MGMNAYSLLWMLLAVRAVFAVFVRVCPDECVWRSVACRVHVDAALGGCCVDKR